ncbi:UNVERIFIED_CONTAM: putative beta-D-xylosidase 7 [Sesamum calycinum]|uniref:Beta-D-xylosidase 7 n=1 Tax=Sesamum calycinum TaxID=2727403 RepID=A0AAW2QLS4_9LAMI
MDVNCGSYLKKYTKSAVAMKKVSELDIDRALENLFSVRMRLGLFNGDPRNLQYGDIDPSHVCSQNHLDLALEAAKSGIVLLKNDLGLLPFSRAETQVASSLEQYYVSSTKYHQGCDFVNCTSALIDEAVETAKQADYVVLVMGLDQTLEREKHDRVELGSWKTRKVSSVAKQRKDLLWEAGGVAVAQTLFGDHNPGGETTSYLVTRTSSKVPMTDMRMRADPSTGYPGRTYRFYGGTKTRPATTTILTSSSLLAPPLLNSSLHVKPKLLFSIPGLVILAELQTILQQNDVFSTGKAMKQLVGFRSVSLSPGETKEIAFVVNPCRDLSYSDEDGVMLIEESILLWSWGDEEYPVNLVV